MQARSIHHPILQFQHDSLHAANDVQRQIARPWVSSVRLRERLRQQPLKSCRHMKSCRRWPGAVFNDVTITDTCLHCAFSLMYFVQFEWMEN